MRRALVVAFVAVGLLAVTAGTSGCATYALDRLKDTADIFGFKFLAGPGVKFGVGVGATKTGFNFGYYRFDKYGFQGRAAGHLEETGLEFLMPADHHLEAVWGNKELFDMVEEFQRLDGIMARGALFDFELTYPRRRFHTTEGLHMSDAWPGFTYFPVLLSFGDIQFTAALVFGVEFNLSFYQFADWLVGWFTLDIAKDDARHYTPIGPRED